MREFLFEATMKVSRQLVGGSFEGSFEGLFWGVVLGEVVEGG